MLQQKKIVSFLCTLTTLILESVFPRRCFGCGTYETHLCENCFKKIPRRTPATLFVASERPSTSPLDSLSSATFFRVPIVARLIHNFKFQGIQELGDPLGLLLLEAIEHTSIPLPDIITAVPLHPKRLKGRGFNQSALLAQKVTTSLNSLVPLTHYETLLIRTRNTPPQSKLKDRKKRLSNLYQAFESKQDLAGKTIWLIDDVTTTSTTLNECAAVLKAQGAKYVHGFVIAH